MRVLQIVPSVSLVYGGPSQMVLGLSKALAAEGVEVTLLTTNSNGDAGQPPLDVPLQQPLSQDGYKIIYFRCSPFRRYKFSLDLLGWLANNAKAYNLAHIHALFSPISTAAATVARIKKLPYIMRPLGTLDPADLQKKRQLKQIYGQLLEKPNLANAAAVHFTSEQERQISERFGAQTRDLVIPLGVELPPNLPELGTTRKQLGIAAEKPLILYMSRLDPKKGLDLLIPALERLLREGVDFHFVLAGGNPQNPDYERKIREQIKASQLANWTTITGFVTGEKKLGLLQDADLFVLPSYYENFGIAVAEAMAAATPVVISDQVHIWQEVQEAEAGWVTKCNIDSLTKTIKSAIEEVDSRQERGMKAKKLVIEKYSWDAIARQTIVAYKQIMKASESRDLGKN
ncbi:hormogonium polysaccharide biosynthesis glycosyltransferase HpsP [Oscillatoria salina]|uniref:hormogonium polysaccharide biosynthesis glycosyltransferase HpsP n=1 Tax=Oscillatoria salina TaxID=331517 RepID=UPI0013B9913B|nr:hormogonium polysaccharide biosynthesis glycosyltransferase HpsP [Oscillatoria salina]MBZ8178505.1 glycosyltransferase [Oscillatoria salina IIICB1]NET87998.1 glycosyltransferase [Kamptonema sp. SIO1D9]